MFNENPALWTLVQLADRDGQTAIAALNGDFSGRAEDYDDKDDVVAETVGRFDDYEMEFANNRSRAAFRRSSVTTAGAHGKSVEVDVDVQQHEDSRPYVNDFLVRLTAIGNNLRQWNYTLYLDFEAARKRFLEPESNAEEFELDETKRFELMLKFLAEISTNEGIEARLSMLRSSDGPGISCRGLFLDEGHRRISEQLLEDAAYFDDLLEQRYGGFHPLDDTGGANEIY